MKYSDQMRMLVINKPLNNVVNTGKNLKNASCSKFFSLDFLAVSSTADMYCQIMFRPRYKLWSKS